MKNKKEKRSLLSFGFSTILFAFVMICVVVFSALSMISAYSDYKLSKKVADKTQNYYKAEEHAYETIAAIDSILAECYESADNQTAYYQQVKERLANLNVIINTASGCSVSFQEPIASQQYLSVIVSITYPQAPKDTFFEIQEWKSVYEQTTIEDEPLNLIQ